MRTIEQQTAETSQLLGEELVRRGEKMLSLGRALLGQAEALEAIRGRAEYADRQTLPPPEIPLDPEPGVELLDPREIKLEQTSHGEFGLITFQIAKTRAEELGDFTHAEFATRVGLASSDAMRWLSILMEKKMLKFKAGRFECCTAPSMRDWVTRQTEPFEVSTAAKATKLTEAEAKGQLDMLVIRQIAGTINGSGMYQYVPTDSILSPRTRPRKRPPEKEAPNFADAPERGLPVRRSAGSKLSRRARSTEGAGGVRGFKQRDRRYEEMQAKEARAEAQSAKAKRQPRKTRSKRAA